MFPLIGAAGSALSLLNTVLQSSSAGGLAKTGGDLLSSLGKTLTGSDSQPPQPVAGSGQGAPPLSDATLATLIALKGQDGANGKGGLFAKLDTDGDGKISKGEFENALGKAGVTTSSADKMFNEIDANHDGNISQAEMGPGRRSHHSHSARQGGLSALLNSTDVTGASTKTSTNADGSSTTTVTYADGSSVSLTTPAAGSTSSGASAGNTRGTEQANMLQQLIRLQSQLTAHGSAATSMTA